MNSPYLGHLGRQVVLYRKGSLGDPTCDEDELDAINAAGFPVYHHRTACSDEVVIGRYSVLPFYKELENDLKYRDCELINTFHQHQFIADMRAWCQVLGDLTPKLYPRLQDLPEYGPFVVKGQTNSKKFQWDTHMFAATRRDATIVAGRLMEDSLFQDQAIYARDYVPLKRLMTGFNGLPITNEWRIFVLDQKIVTYGFYWASHMDDLGKVPDCNIDFNFVQKAIDKIGENACFYALDVAQTEKGDWTVIEINDGQMS
jgi:hypothetical protein